MAVVFSGHRPRRLWGTQDQIDAFCMKAIPSLIGNEHCWIGMALGFDQGAALACLCHDIPYTAAIPYRGYETMWSSDLRIAYNQLVTGATNSAIVCEGGFHVSKLFARNHWMIDMVRVYANPRLICLWDGMEKGGTWDTIQQAEAWDFQIVNLWEQWVKFK